MSARLFFVLCIAASAFLLFRSWSTEAAGDPARPDPVRTVARALPSAPTRSTAAPAAVAIAAPAPVADVGRDADRVDLSIDLPQKLKVGELIEMRIAIDARRAVGRVALTVEVDPNVLQVRGASEGDWPSSAGVVGGFSTDGGSDARVRILSGASGRAMIAGRGCVVIVQLQAVAPGTSFVNVNDITVTDTDRRAIPFTATRWTQVTAESDAAPPAAAG